MIARRRLGIIVMVAGIAPAAISSSASASTPASFIAGAAFESYTPPAAGTLQSDPADCLTPADPGFTGKRHFAFEEPYIDQQGTGHHDPGDPFIDTATAAGTGTRSVEAAMRHATTTTSPTRWAPARS